MHGKAFISRPMNEADAGGVGFYRRSAGIPKEFPRRPFGQCPDTRKSGLVGLPGPELDCPNDLPLRCPGTISERAG